MLEGRRSSQDKMVPREGREEERRTEGRFRREGTRGEDTYVLKKIYTGTVARERRKGGAAKGV